MISEYSDNTPDESDVADKAIAENLVDIHTIKVGRVEEVDTENQIVSVQPMVKLASVGEDGDYTVAAYPVITGLPIMSIGANGFRMVLDVKVGDLGTIFHADGSLDNWLAGDGSMVDPEDVRRFHISDAMFLPGLMPYKKAWSNIPSDGMAIGHNDGPNIILKSDEIQIGGTSSDAATEKAVLGTSYTSDLQAILNTFDSFVTSLNTSAVAGASIEAGFNLFCIALKAAFVNYTAGKSNHILNLSNDLSTKTKIK